MPNKRIFVTKEHLSDMVERQKMTYREIADVFGCCVNTVQYYLTEYGLTSGPKRHRDNVHPPIDAELLRKMYVEEGGSLKSIGLKVGKDGTSIRYWLKKLGIKTRKPWETSVGKYVGPLAAGWKGGRRKDSHGYVSVYSVDHPNGKKISRRGRYVFEHRLVMEKHLGRYLEPWEIVHHINGARDDNRLVNLELLPEGEHNKKIQDIIKENNSLRTLCSFLLTTRMFGRGAI